MRRLLLINPWIHDFSAYDLWIQPLGLLYLAGVLEKNGFELQYLNCLRARYDIKADGRAKFVKQNLPTPEPLKEVHRVYGQYGIPAEEFRAELIRVNCPDAILITSGMTYWYPGLQATIREVRGVFPDAPIILGGIYATLMTEHAKQTSGADTVVAGPFENGILNLLTNKSEAQSFPNLDDYPHPAWRLTGETRYRILLTSRGCPYRCTFCASDTLNQQKFRQRSVRNIYAEIEKYHYEDHITNFVFYDDALLVNHRRHLSPLLLELIRNRIRAHFHTPNGLNAAMVTEELALLMYQCGFRTIRLSLESADAEIQKRQGNSKVTNASFRAAVEHLNRAGYGTGELESYLIMGLPGQTADQVRNSLEFVSDLGVIARLATFSPIPGTPEAEEARRKIGNAFLQEPLLQNHSVFPLKNTSMTQDDLQEIKLECARNNDRIRQSIRPEIASKV
jgi:radical SAM superfamily enzyme YgiQ (UPF0313 family)